MLNHRYLIRLKNTFNSLSMPKGNVYGRVDSVDRHEVLGWAIDINKVSDRLKLEILVGDTVIGSTIANVPRPDVEAFYNVRGQFGFMFYTPHAFSDEEIDAVRVYVPEHGRFLNNKEATRVKSPAVAPHSGHEMRLHIETIDSLRQVPRQAYEWLRLDPILNCNLKCSYCHNYRTTKKFEMDDMEQFIHEKISRVINVQVGCSMEPTLDTRLCDVFEMIARSSAKPAETFQLTTNAILLHRHDCARLIAAGLNHMVISIDTYDPATLRTLRGGTNVDRVVENVLSFRKNFPNIKTTFNCVVTKLNVKELSQFVASSIDLGVRNFVFHEVFYFPETKTHAGHEKMSELLLEEGEFYEAQRDIMMKFSGQATFLFAHDEYMKRIHKECGVEDKWKSVSRKSVFNIVE